MVTLSHPHWLRQPLSVSLELLGSPLCPFASPAGCGVPAISPSVYYSERIVNGQNAVPGSWPWQVSLQTRSGSHFCGGSLINENWVVTAAHCNFNPYSHVVVLGEYNLNYNTETTQVKTVSRAITNPNWNPNTFNSDITLLRLSSPAQLGPSVSPVCLPPANLVLPNNLQCVTTGWGRTNPNSQALATRLQQVTLPLISSSQCMQYWGNRITNSMLCAGGVGASSCQGDSGGPLVYQNGNVWTLIGIVSFGNSNCNVRTPAIYTRVSLFRNWIDYIVAQG
ncbi:chymotrypsin-like protease CTRL-1 isoform X1 [Athene cunicularia]|uniref:chymotrypsin-like protease CTRL-1 isoform X1 n=1 Tax=Athene cunicularia TaxID=194338 RepID=UPI000EF71789|nr:chymotrypsin-like protease CTRL-1 isoform X1 [Athene cunicularia]